MLGFGHLALRESFNKRLTLTILLICFSQFNFGFDQQGFSTTQAMDAFAKQFGYFDEKKQKYELDSVWLSMFNGFIPLGQATGVLLGSWVSKRWGRRWCMFSMSIWAIVCATLVITSKTPEQILVARVLNYIYIGMELAVVPVFQSEIVPKQARGFIVGTYQISLYMKQLGGLVINCIARGTGSLPGKEAYMIPWGLFYVVPTIVAVCVLFVPESPRWLALNDRGEDAKKALQLFRGGKYSEEDIETEYNEILESIEREKQKGTFIDIFSKKQIWRTIVVSGANFFLQATGQLFTTIYGALFVRSLGTVNPFTVTVAISIINVCTSLLAMVLTDKLGRRFQVFVGAAIQCSAQMTMGGLGTTKNPSANIKIGIISMMAVSTFGYSLGWAPTSHILSAEIPSTTHRDMTYRTASVLNIFVQFVVGFTLPYLLNEPYAALGSKVGFIFGTVSALSLVFAFFLVPDVSGRALEDIDRLFESGVPIRKFRGHVLEPMVEPDHKDKDPDVIIIERQPPIV